MTGGNAGLVVEVKVSCCVPKISGSPLLDDSFSKSDAAALQRAHQEHPVVSRRQEKPIADKKIDQKCDLRPSLAEFRTKLVLAPCSRVPSREANVHHDTGREEVDTVGVRAGAKPQKAAPA